MRKPAHHHFSLILISLILLAACLPARPVVIQPTLDPTLVSVAAEATVTALARANAPTRTPTTQPPAITTTATTAPTVQSSDFWVVYLFQHKLSTINGDGSQNILLTNTPGIDYLPIWSSDGMNLAFIRFNGLSHQDGN